MDGFPSEPIRPGGGRMIMYGDAPDPGYYGEPYYGEYLDPMPQMMQTRPVMPEPMMSLPTPLVEQPVYMHPPPVYVSPRPSPPKQRKWNMCPFVLGMILLFCGMLVVALCFYMSQLPEKAIKRTCELMLPKRSRVVGCDMTTSAALLATTPLLQTSAYTLQQCKLDMYVAWGCKCKDASSGAACVTHEDMTCKDAGFSYFLAGLYERWEVGMWLTGGIGFLILLLFVIVPAFKAAVSGSVSLVVFSTCSGLWCVPFFVASGFFFAIAAAFREERMAIYDTFNSMCVNPSATMASHCGTYVWCDTIREVRVGDEYQVTASAAMAGLGCLIAALCMFAGMFVCCCCKSPPVEDPVPVRRPMQQMKMAPPPVYEIRERPVVRAPPVERMYEPYYEPTYVERTIRRSPMPLEAGLYPSVPMYSERSVRPPMYYSATGSG